MLQRLALLLTLGAVLNTVEGIAAWQHYCVYALVWAWGLLCEQQITVHITTKDKQ